MQPPYIAHLSKSPFFKRLLEDEPAREIAVNKNIPLFLYTSIISQQLSTKVADVFARRFLNIYNGINPLPQEIINTPIEMLQAIGLSKSKANYIKNVAQFDIDHGLDYDKLVLMTDGEVSAYVTTIKGIGRWSVQILLMFGLGREDVFSADDLIIQNAMAAIFHLDKKDKKNFREQVIGLSSEWSPYRTYACLHLWKWYHGKRIEEEKAALDK